MATLFNERRTAEAAAFLLHKASGTLPFIKLLKLMYLAERLSLQRYAEPLTGDRLVSMDHGPVLSITYNHIKGAAQSNEGGWDTWVADKEGYVVALKDPSMVRSPEQDLLHLSETDLEVLGEIWNEFGHWDRWQLIKYTHDSLPEWEDPKGSSLPITYNRLFEALGYSADETNLVVERLAEQERLNEQFA